LIARQYPDTTNKLYLCFLLTCPVVIFYYRLHLSMYYNYSKVFFMSILVFFGTMFTGAILGIIINIYCIYQANKMLKNTISEDTNITKSN
jgi:hypothetical protein